MARPRRTFTTRALALAMAAFLSAPGVPLAGDTYTFRMPNPAAQAAAATSRSLLDCVTAAMRQRSGPFSTGFAATAESGCHTSEDGAVVYVAPLTVTPPMLRGIGGKFIGMQPPPGITGAFDRHGKPLPRKAPVATKPTVKVVNFPALATVGDQVTATFATTGMLGVAVSIADGALPPGIQLDQASLTGQFTTAGSYAFTLRASRGGDPSVYADAKVSVTVAAKGGTGTDPTTPVDPAAGMLVSYPKLQGRKGDAVQALPTVRNAKGPLTYKLKAGSVPPDGIGLNAVTGAVGGKGLAVTSGNLPDPSFLVTVSDGTSTVDAKVSYTIWVKVASVQPGEVLDTQDFDLTTSTVLPKNAQTLTFALAETTNLKGAMVQTSGGLDPGLVRLGLSTDGFTWKTLVQNVDYTPVVSGTRYVFILNTALPTNYLRLTNNSTSDYVLTQVDLGIGDDANAGTKPTAALSVQYDMLDGVEGDAASSVPTVANATGMPRYSIKDPSRLPAGITFDPSSGAIGGRKNFATLYSSIPNNFFTVVTQDDASTYETNIFHYVWLRFDDVTPGKASDVQDLRSGVKTPMPGNGKSLVVTLNHPASLARLQLGYTGGIDTSMIGLDVSSDGVDWTHLVKDTDYYERPAVASSYEFLFNYKNTSKYVRITNNSTTDYYTQYIRIGP